MQFLILSYRHYLVDADTISFFVASDAKINPNKLTKIVKIKEVKIHIF